MITNCLDAFVTPPGSMFIFYKEEIVTISNV